MGDRGKIRMGSAFAGDLLRYSSLRWSDHNSLLVPRISSRKSRCAAMWDYEIGSIISRLQPAALTAAEFDLVVADRTAQFVDEHRGIGSVAELFR
jgi:hypothetical protein